MSNPSLNVLIDGKIVPQNEVQIPADSSAVRYGTGCFETFLAENGKIFKLDDHLDRLNRGIKYLNVNHGKAQDLPTLRNDILRLLKENDLQDRAARVRIQYMLHEYSGYLPERVPDSQLLISATPVTSGSADTALMISETITIPHQSRPADLKLSNMLHYRAAAREAYSQSVDDAILLTKDGFVAETSIANLFWKRGDVVYTPDTNCDILPGVMRNNLIEMMKNFNDVHLEMGRYDVNHLKDADTVWLTNSVREITFVKSIENHEFQTNTQFCAFLKTQFSAYKNDHLQ